jgi:hypothetical protein
MMSRAGPLRKPMRDRTETSNYERRTSKEDGRRNRKEEGENRKEEGEGRKANGLPGIRQAVIRGF